MKTETIIRALTISSLTGLLLTIGLRLTVAEVIEALRRCRLVLVLFVNFAVVPALAVGLITLFGIERNLAVGMILLAAAPFAPVVPIFTRMARGDLALAAGLTSLITLLSAFLTPMVTEVALKAVSGANTAGFSVTTVLPILIGTIVLPLGIGVGIHQVAPRLGRWVLRPLEVISETMGFLSLAFVTATEFRSILSTGPRPLLIMILLSEVSLLLGYAIGGTTRGTRLVVALGTSNRNIALALLLAIQSYPNTPVVPAVVANGLLLILLGLLHVALWRPLKPESRGA
jgi:BASS family bile acid:Na+ symporter